MYWKFDIYIHVCVGGELEHTVGCGVYNKFGFVKKKKKKEN